eukprot:924333-Amphidinium_carterae.1
MWLPAFMLCVLGAGSLKVDTGTLRVGPWLRRDAGWGQHRVDENPPVGSGCCGRSLACNSLTCKGIVWLTLQPTTIFVRMCPLNLQRSGDIGVCIVCQAVRHFWFFVAWQPKPVQDQSRPGWSGQAVHHAASHRGGQQVRGR